MFFMHGKIKLIAMTDLTFGQRETANNRVATLLI